LHTVCNSYITALIINDESSVTWHVHYSENLLTGQACPTAWGVTATVLQQKSATGLWVPLGALQQRCNRQDNWTLTTQMSIMSHMLMLHHNSNGEKSNARKVSVNQPKPISIVPVCCKQIAGYSVTWEKTFLFAISCHRSDKCAQAKVCNLFTLQKYVSCRNLPRADSVDSWAECVSRTWTLNMSGARLHSTAQ